MNARTLVSFSPRIALVFVALLPALRGQNDVVTDIVLPDVTFGHLGAKPAAPTPTLLVFAMDRKTSLQNPSFSRGPRSLQSKGVFCVSIDMPAHGDDSRKGEEGLKGWAARLHRGENVVAPFLRQTSAALDYLLRERYTAPKKIAIFGVSRGGFMGFHVMAADPRIVAVAALGAPAELTAVREFSGAGIRELASSLALRHLVPRLAGRPVWLLIGNRDTRIDTNRGIDFMQALFAAAPADMILVPAELHVVAGEDHRQPPLSHERAAAWLETHLLKP